MNKVLIADDELLVRNYIRSLLDWEQYDFEVCGEAANGVEALKQIKALKPDLVILDINMPVMDGVALSENIARDYPEIKMLVLSSYDDYEFVRETLKNGALDYILKDCLDEAELSRILSQIREKIGFERRAQSELALEKSKINVIKEIAAEQYIKDIFFGTTQYSDEIIQSIGLPLEHLCKDGFVVAVMQIGNYIMRTNGQSDLDKEHFLRSVKNLCRQSLNDDPAQIVSYLDNGRFVFLFPTDGHRSEASLYGLLNQNTRKISFILNQFLNVQVTWGISSRCFSTTQISSRFNEALRALNHKQYSEHFQNGRAACSGEKAGSKLNSLTVHYEKELLVAVESADISRTAKILDEIFAATVEGGQPDLLFQSIINELTTTAIKIASEYNLDSRKIYQSCGVDLQALVSQNDFEVLKDALKSIYKTLIEESVKSCHSGNYSGYSRKAIDYIILNYDQEISLVGISELLGINPAYFSRLFRKDTNYGFVEYLNKVRIEIAKKRLANGEKNLKKLCLDIGFKSYSYFFKVFKEHTGSTPLNYTEKKD